MDVIFRKVRGILNKITPETFEKLSKDLINVGLDSPKTLRGVIYLIFDKALKDLKYSSLYAKLCQELSEKVPNFEQNKNGPNTFCKFLISKCEDEFERRRRATENFDKLGQLTDEEFELRTIAKQKMLGNIKFICELGKKRLLQEEILHECIRGLLSKKRESSIQDQAQDLECLCQIMRTIGSLLDIQASKNLMNQYFERIDLYSKNPELPSRIRFMLKDIMDLRKNNWKLRPFQREDNAPQTLSKLREEASTTIGTVDKYGNNKNVGDIGKLFNGKMSMYVDDEPSFTTSSDFHYGPQSFLPFDDPFNDFANPKQQSINPKPHPTTQPMQRFSRSSLDENTPPKVISNSRPALYKPPIPQKHRNISPRQSIEPPRVYRPPQRPISPMDKPNDDGFHHNDHLHSTENRNRDFSAPRGRGPIRPPVRFSRGFDNSPPRGHHNSPPRGFQTIQGRDNPRPFHNSPPRGFHNSPPRGFHSSPPRAPHNPPSTGFHDPKPRVIIAPRRPLTDENLDQTSRAPHPPKPQPSVIQPQPTVIQPQQITNSNNNDSIPRPTFNNNNNNRYQPPQQSYQSRDFNYDRREHRGRFNDFPRHRDQYHDNHHGFNRPPRNEFDNRPPRNEFERPSNIDERPPVPFSREPVQPNPKVYRPPQPATDRTRQIDADPRTRQPRAIQPQSNINYKRPIPGAPRENVAPNQFKPAGDANDNGPRPFIQNRFNNTNLNHNSRPVDNVIDDTNHFGRSHNHNDLPRSDFRRRDFEPPRSIPNDSRLGPNNQQQRSFHQSPPRRIIPANRLDRPRFPVKDENIQNSVPRLGVNPTKDPVIDPKPLFLTKPISIRSNNEDFSLRPAFKLSGRPSNINNNVASNTNINQDNKLNVSKPDSNNKNNQNQDVRAPFASEKQVANNNNNNNSQLTSQDIKSENEQQTMNNEKSDIHIRKFNSVLEKSWRNTKPWSFNVLVNKIKELKIPKQSHCDCLVSLMKSSISSNDSDRDNVGKLMPLLVPSIFDMNSLSAAFKTIFDQLTLLEVETPRVKSFVAGLLSQAVYDGLVSFEEIGEMLKGGKYHPLFLLFLQKLDKQAGQAWLMEKYLASKINLMEMLSEADQSRERLASVLKDRSLGYLDPMLTIEPDLWFQMKNKDSSPAAIYRWIKDNVHHNIQTTPAFVHVLVSCLMKYIHESSTGSDSPKDEPDSNKSTPTHSSSSGNEAEKELLTKYQQILQALIKDKQMQLATLYAVQNFYHKLDFPKGSLLRWFDMLYDLNIVDEDVYFTWKEEINDEFPGKGQALFQVNTWLNWLAEAESEEEDE